MKIIILKKTYLFFALFLVLGALYAVNIFNINKVSDLIIDKPVKLSFIEIIPDKKNCDKCFDTQGVIDLISASHNTKISVKKAIDSENNIYADTLKKYSIKTLPALIVSGDIEDSRILGAWKSFNGKKVDGKIVIQDLLPFYDVEEKKVKGLIDIILLKDDKCTDCFDELEYIKMIERRGMVISNAVTYNISSKEGSSIVKQYRIRKIPTIILSSDAGDYSGFKQSWKQEVGTEEEDGSFVLREVQKITNGLKFKKI